MNERATIVELALNVGSDPITGSVAVGIDKPTSFCGWIELVAAIEAVRHGSDLAMSELAAPDSAEAGLH